MSVRGTIKVPQQCRSMKARCADTRIVWITPPVCGYCTLMTLNDVATPCRSALRTLKVVSPKYFSQERPVGGRPMPYVSMFGRGQNEAAQRARNTAAPGIGAATH